MAGRGAWTVNANAPFPSQISAMTVTGYYAIGELRLTAPGGRFGASWIPTLTGKKQQSVSSYGVAMLKTSKNKDATWRVMKYMSSPEATKIFYEKNGWLGGLHKDLGKYIDPRKDPGLMWFLQSIEQVDTVTNFPGPVADISGPANTVWTDAFEKGIRNQGDIRTILQEGNDRVNTIAAEVQRKSGK
jgi:ABC-type glycerol-3-phosphate transport system substrate-binding protein